MITAEIKLHKEPEPVVTVMYGGYTKPPANTNNVLPFAANVGCYFTQFELLAEQTRAINFDIKIGTRWKVKNSIITVQIVGWNITAGKQEVIDDKPAIIRGQRITAFDAKGPIEFNYSVDEILEMEKVYD